MDTSTIPSFDKFYPQKSEAGDGYPSLSGYFESPDGMPMHMQGQTGFFRYRKLMQRIIRHYLDKPAYTPLRFLFAPCSIGCEPYSFAAMADREGLFRRHPRTHIDALDICPNFIDFARHGHYPASLLSPLRFDEAASVLERGLPLSAIFENATTDRLLPVAAHIRTRVNFLPPQALASYTPEAPYDFVMSTNLLIHIDDATMEATCNTLANICNGYLATSYSGIARMDGDFTMTVERPGARRTLAQAGFVRLKTDTLEPHLEAPARVTLPRFYSHMCAHAFGGAVLLAASGTRPPGHENIFAPVKRFARAFRELRANSF